MRAGEGSSAAHNNRWIANTQEVSKKKSQSECHMLAWRRAEEQSDRE